MIPNLRNRHIVIFMTETLLQFKNLVLNNRNYLKRILNIKNQEIIYDNPYFQKQTSRQQSCQIDYVIQTSSESLYIFETKLSRYKVQHNVIEEVRKRLLD